MKIKPLYDRVVVRRIEEDTKTASGIVIPESATEKPSQGEVIAAGPGKLLDNGQLRAMSVKAGDRILFGKYSGSEVKLGAEELLVMREDDILGTVEQ